ncbi:sensor domain-containing protein [Streptomyces sp. NBS 14/10]|uniref:sensor histidine kinase n=1 Tax=Streptomyces sp. NBS 14/10 TaxID=1945643 RepID=UPI000B7F511E|nr:sensor domain-containing protein [Streptomyces sp. NBS 14/10]KAK1179107.1 sensor domain-containing protein [Streptomyces sp. NBS 14/10]NUP38920.1 sensor histidine kinase [Streptomyces sp.]NUS81356.1 sensor histidine kinase [Streptomyces sp.]
MGGLGAGGLRALVRCQLLGLVALAVVAVGGLVIGALLLLPIGLGFRLLPPAAGALRGLSDRYRSWTARWTGTAISPPDPLAPDPLALDRAERPRRRAAAVLGDEGFWRDLRWAWLEPWFGGLLVAVPLALVEYGAFGALVQPFIWRLLDDGNWYAFIPVRSTPTMLAALALGLAFIAAGVRLAPVVLGLHGRWSRRLLSAPRSTELARRVERLTDIRDESLDAQAAELRRIERDLHDGAQARLVALGMTLDEATRLLDVDLDAARGLLLDVRDTSARALQDLRDLVHGIQPPVLADRGLGDAVRSLALDSFLDVHVEVRLPGRLPAPVESAAYFAISEALANAAKHSGAQEVRITLTFVEHEDLAHEDGARLLRVTVTDDGRGGADLARGTGLRGVQRRLGTFDGSLALHSPLGGPTTVTLEIPCASSSPKTSSCSGTG